MGRWVNVYGYRLYFSPADGQSERNGDIVPVSWERFRIKGPPITNRPLRRHLRRPAETANPPPNRRPRRNATPAPMRPASSLPPPLAGKQEEMGWRTKKQKYQNAYERKINRRPPNALPRYPNGLSAIWPGSRAA
jgi:hypothetical protein